MKNVISHPPREERPKMWRSLAELENSPEFEEHLHREFPEGASLYEDSGLSRRDFVKLMGASMALAGAGLAACRRPEAHLVPFTESAEWMVPGKFLYYATSIPTRVGAMPLVATTVDGRPTKLEGNPLHPCSQGGTDGFAQASVLDLYDPHRGKNIIEAGFKKERRNLAAFLELIRKRYTGDGRGFAVLSERKDSPTRARLREEIETAFPGVMWAEYEPLGANTQEEAAKISFGSGADIAPKLEEADVVLAVGSDFLNCGEVGVSYARGFNERRNPEKTDRPMNRLYAVENQFSLTGGMADHRLRVKAGQFTDFVLAIAKEVASGTGDSALKSLLASAKSGGASFNEDWVRECAADLVAHRGKVAVLTGPQLPLQAQLLAIGINQALGAFGTTLEVQETGRKESASIQDLVGAIDNNRINTLFILGGNPVYNAPAELQFSRAISKVTDTLMWSMFENETTKHMRWYIPAAHYLESWEDSLTFRGVYTAVQPMILPLWNGVPEFDLLGMLLGKSEDDLKGPAQVKQTFTKKTGLSGANLDSAWNEFLKIGFLEKSSYPTSRGAFKAAAAASALAKAGPVSSEGDELVFIQSSSMDDGRYANNSWLQETPDFATKLTWDNALLVSPSDAKAQGLKEGNLVEVSAAGAQITAGVMIAPGHANGSYSIALGYGREIADSLLDKVGFNAYPLRTTKGFQFVNNAKLSKTGEDYVFAATQLHASMEGRDLAREGTLDKFKKDPAFAQNLGVDSHLTPLVKKGISLYDNTVLTSPEQWAMSIDLNTCTGCNACLVACRAENNVPVVGKDQVRRGRDMAWIRIDRWFAGEAEEPEMVPQAIMCQHCENAPCETVCPVNATVHSEDGLNLMAYNRCIGTRYCANNCPWKVRRFNFFDYNQRPLDKLYWGPAAKKGMADSLKMVKNPNVTVRMRGVMEKCTFCLQRIEEAKIARTVKAGPTAKNKVPIGPFQVACQQACPSDSILFGNENDPKSAVAKARKSDRGYTMFNYVNARSRVTYLARIKNPNMKMPGADRVGRINTEPHHGSHDEHGEEHIPSGADHGAHAGA
ncbi:MAG: TAT-variant-translocated molybdopterin oxidoreductase [Chthoniobacterales bacterium]